MKIVKTNSRYHLHRMGFPIALKFGPEDGNLQSHNVRWWLTERYGEEPWPMWEKKNHPWCSKMGRWSRKKGVDTFIGLKDESIITALVLALDLNVVK